ncbi:cytochrome c peroxidase [Rhodovulum sulfidophilum]|uniref:cytochrome-c peroxidase n=1 Tax=Rhodovulum sulfidophilum TaxID=35806 RepID=UPI0005A7A3F4|nr:cytochrome c peroxidase [Rhodovulum sulfidophilum]ANB34901.1 methylamine utilization protein MauG [Rhodovulum sulfidophilum DSM 1374]ANB38723.1 methylamine utilization protein MauG [Rhodovulum sulfidophilum]MCW2302224.1 cytochrome c peroxidase [Rhodovulum sulfidophilum]
MTRTGTGTGLTLAAALLACGAASADPEEGAYSSPEAFGEALFFDVNLSKTRTQACATCHDPGHAFIDPRPTLAGRAVSLGADGQSLGDRNAPTAAYARFSPPFGQRADGTYVGGQFHDGRAAGLAEQAAGPPLNPIEMGLADVEEAAARILENPRYDATLSALYGAATPSDPEAVFRAATSAIAAFEGTDSFAPFDSKYDRYLRGEAQLTDEEELGRILFFSQQFTNCNLCHQLRKSAIAADETFTDYSYHNIGVPANAAARAVNGAAGPDLGLLANPAVEDPAAAGKFKVPTLRNVAVTGPYMHNGVFEDLRTVILFYNKYNSKAAARQIDPETGEAWAAPEVPGTLSMDKLTTGPALDDERIDALVAFLETLTDSRYAYLLDRDTASAGTGGTDTDR